ncbi:MAG TPA: hypothetical protein VE398_11740 [Acidobacteriota bacterium]|nr:hypothetical protein [Acidobacteriota bacterium]
MRTESILRAVAAIAVVVGMELCAVLAQGGLASLGIKEAEARKEIAYALPAGRVPWYLAAKAFKAAPAAARPKLVTDALNWIKSYVESPAFKSEYENQRRQKAPAPPADKGSIDDQIAKQRAEQRKSIDEMKKNVAKMPPEMQKQMEQTVRQMEEQADRSAKDPKMTAMLRQSFELQHAEERKSYELHAKQYEQSYPADPKVLVARRLKEFLELSKDIDFNARLASTPSGKKRFVDPKLEARSDNWKTCFRAGRETVEAARAFAQEWLKQLER